MVRALTILVLYQLIGTVIQQATDLPIPGAVLGLIMALFWFLVIGPPSADMRQTAQGLLKYLGLLFVPAGVGVINNIGLLRKDIWAIAISIIVSTILGMLVTGVTMQWFLNRQKLKTNA